MDKGREAIEQALIIIGSKQIPLASQDAVTCIEKLLRSHGWHREEQLDKCRHFHLAESHKGKYRCCYFGAPVCKIRAGVCAMLIPKQAMEIE